MAMKDRAKRGSNDPLFEEVARLVQAGMGQGEAARLVAETNGKNPNTFPTSYSAWKRRMTWGKKKTPVVPPQLADALDRISAANDAIAEILGWVSSRELELDERERAISAKEMAVRIKVQETLDRMFGGSVMKSDVEGPKGPKHAHEGNQDPPAG